MLTDRQQQVLETYVRCGESVTATARELKVSHQTISQHMKAIRAAQARAGVFPKGTDHTHLVPEGYAVKGVSTLENAETGEAKLRWVKVSADQKHMLQLLHEAFDAIAESVPPAHPIKCREVCDEDILSTYVITDYHLGMLAWAEETGDDWDTRKAEQALEAWFWMAIENSPPSGTAIFAQMGDFLHWDGLEAVTPTNRHVLDADTRFQRLVRVAIRVIKRITTMLLQKHEKVIMIMAEGNHDIASSVWLRELFAQLYREEPRVEVITRPDPYYCVPFGKVSLFFHHGHKKRIANLADIFVAKFREIYGSTVFSYAHTGHLHHNVVLENNLMVLEQHRTLAAPDAHAARGGWMSGREAKVIIYHREYGEVERITINYHKLKVVMNGG